MEPSDDQAIPLPPAKKRHTAGKNKKRHRNLLGRYICVGLANMYVLMMMNMKLTAVLAVTNVTDGFIGDVLDLIVKT